MIKPGGNPWVWSLYDFANSLASITVSFYFSLFVVGELGRGDIWVSLPVALATFLLLVTLPFWGSRADKVKKYKPALAFTTIASIVSLFLMGLCAVLVTDTPSIFWAVVVCYFFFQYFYQAALGFYLPFLQSLSKTRSRSFVASLGLAAGQLGNITGLVVAFILISSNTNVLGLTGTPLVICFSAVLFLIFFGIFNKKFREESYNHHAVQSGSFLPKSFLELYDQFASLRHEKNVLWYLITYYLFADAVLTLQLFASLYLDQVGHLSTTMKTFGFVIGMCTAIVGALLTPWLLRNCKSYKRTLGHTIIIWAAMLVGMALARTPAQMIIMLTLNGFGFGTLFSQSRIMYSRIIPTDEPAKYFGLYVLFEKFASILGPLVWSFSAYIFAFAGPEAKYRFAVGALALIVVVSYFTLKKVKEEYRS